MYEFVPLNDLIYQHVFSKITLIDDNRDFRKPKYLIVRRANMHLCILMMHF